MKYIGNKQLLYLRRVAFFSSSKFNEESERLTEQWAKNAAETGLCVISGFQSTLERKVLDILLEGNGKIIISLACSINPYLSEKYDNAVKQERFLMISQFDDGLTSSNRHQCYLRNLRIMDKADEIVIGSLSPDGMLAKALKEANKPYTILR